MSELTEEEREALAKAAHCAPDKQIMAALGPAVAGILATRRPRIEAEALRRLADKVKAQERAALQRGLIALADRYRVTFSCLRDEADRLDPREE